jgi:hypothetical protein
VTRIAFVGSRDWNDDRSINNRLHDYDPATDVIVSGAARGADRAAARLARVMGFKVVEYPADWDRFGKRAGFLRNQAIVDNCDKVVAFWDGESRGTADTIERARKAGKPVTIVRPW